MLFPSGCWVSIKRCPSGETNSFFEADEKQSVPTSRLVWSKKKKFLKAFLDAAIMAEMAQRSAMKATDIIDFFDKKCLFQISPGTLYPILDKLEKKGYIRKLPNTAKRLYVLTNSGKNELETLQQSMEEAQSFITQLINR